MAIGLIAINCDTLQSKFSGANNSLIYLHNQNNEIIEIKGDKMLIAIYEKMNPFTNHELQLAKGDVLYLTTDGFKDQFGGMEGKKFLQKRFMELIYKCRHLSMKEQGLILEMNLEQWMHGDKFNYKQIDDIIVLGIKIV